MAFGGENGRLECAATALSGGESSKEVYFIETVAHRQRQALCRVVEFFYEAKRRAQVVTDSSLGARNLDQLLWTFEEESFIPHRILMSGIRDRVVEPVVITPGEVFVEGFDHLVCDCPVGLGFMKRYGLSVHFVLQDDVDRKQDSRRLWLDCKDQGVECRHFHHTVETRWSDIFKFT